MKHPWAIGQDSGKQVFRKTVNGDDRLMLKFGIGTDIIEIQRFEQFGEPQFQVFLKKNFSPGELDYCLKKDNPAPHLAVRFAGKEAVIKALNNLNIKGIFFPTIEILNNESGVPYIRINTDKTEKLCIKISLSHSSNMALAFCVIIQEI